MDFQRILAVGDIHGDIQRLRELWKKIDFDDTRDLLVFLGDYIDRGPKPLDVLTFVQRLTERYENVYALLGNHEAMMLHYLTQNGRDGFDPTDIWLSNGGGTTYHQLRTMREEPAEQLIQFVKSLPLYFRTLYEEQRILFVHAGINPAQKKQRTRDLLWTRDSFYENYRGKELVVVGHTSTQSMPRGGNVPLFLPNNIIACDTGSFLPGGRISCVDVRRYLNLCARGEAPSAEELASCYVQSSMLRAVR